METRFGTSFKIWVWSTRTIRHHKKRYVLLPAVENFMVPGALYGHRSDVTLNFEPETCVRILVVTARAGSDAVARSHKLCWDDVSLS